MLRKANRVIANRVIANRVIANRAIEHDEHCVISKYWKCIEKLKPNEKLIVDDLPHYTAGDPADRLGREDGRSCLTRSVYTTKNKMG